MAWAQVYMPADEFATYTDAAGIYTVIGNVKNGMDWAVLPTIHVSLLYDGVVHHVSHKHNVVAAGGELPFILKIPGAVDATVLEHGITYVRAPDPYTGIVVLYDDTLVYRADGSLAGVLKNMGHDTVYRPTVWAVAVGEGGPLDVVRNHNRIESLEPGQTAEFIMYPDPAVAGMVDVYSCFAPVVNGVYKLMADWEGTEYEIRYESGASIYMPVFDQGGTTLTLQTINSFPLETFANLEIPPVTGDETFEVYRSGEPIDFIQSRDEMGLWHLAFDVRAHSQDVIEVRGFVPGPIMPPQIPDYVRENAALWASGSLDDGTILANLWVLADRDLISAQLQGDAHMPAWMRPAMGWYGDGLIDDETFLAMVSYMAERNIIVPG